jgi:predicted dinucleotide-binding enzyme
MKIAVIGTGFIGTILGTALSEAGHEVVFGSRSPSDRVALAKVAKVTSVSYAIAETDAMILVLRGADVAEFATAHREGLAGKLVIDATNNVGGAVTNNRNKLPPTIRYARAFNTVSGEVMAEPMLAGTRADMFFSSLASDREIVETIIDGVGLRPVFVGEDKEDVVDGVFHLWLTLSLQQGRGRRIALHLLED